MMNLYFLYFSINHNLLKIAKRKIIQSTIIYLKTIMYIKKYMILN